MVKRFLLTLTLASASLFAQALCTTPGDNGRSYMDANGVTHTCVYPTLMNIGNLGWQKFSVTLTSTGWSVNGGTPVAAAAALTQTISLFSTHDPYVSAVRFRTTTACTLASGTIKLTGVGETNTSSTQYVSAATYNLESAVSTSNFAFQTIANNFPGVTGNDTVTFNITTTTDNISLIGVGCAFDIQILWASLPL